MKPLCFSMLFTLSLVASELHNEQLTIRINGDYETIDLSQQPQETRRILHKLAYKQYLEHNQWATFKAALLACSITTAASFIAIWYANK